MNDKQEKNMIDQISELLMMEFCSVYCYNCAYNYEKIDQSEDGCYMCHRKYMNWELDINDAKRIAKNIDELYMKQERR